MPGEDPVVLDLPRSVKIDHRFAGRAVFGLVELQGRALPPDSPDRLAWMNRLAALYADESKYDEAEALFSKRSRLSVGCWAPVTRTG